MNLPLPTLRLSLRIAVAALTGAFCAQASLPAIAQSDQVEEVISRVRADSLLQTVRILSGELAAVTPDSTFLITTRWHENNDAALEFLRHRLESHGYSTSLQPFDRGVNAIGVRIGASQPNRLVVICAHYDAVRGTPGADDNASGTAAVLEAARVLAPYSLSSTVVFALWDAEEIGLFGSAHYAAEAAATDADIAAVINIDMIGWDGEPDRDGGPDGVLEVHTDIPSMPLANTVAGYAQSYGLSLDAVVEQPGTSASDHASFWRNGYPAVLLIEELRGGDFNPYYHQVSDLLQHFNAEYYTQATRLAVAAVAELAGLGAVSTDVASPPDLAVLQVTGHPSPFTSTLSVRYELPHPGNIRVAIYDLLGREVARVADGWHSAGEHLTRWNGDHVAAGIYFLYLQTATGPEVYPIVKSE